MIGFLVGMTGAGGGALMTPMLILLFGVKPSSAISSDLVAAVMMRPIGAAVHLRQKTVNLRLVGWMVLGSVPMAFLGSYLLSLMGHAKTAQANIELALGIALLIGASAMVLRYILDRRSGEDRTGIVHETTPRPLRTIAIGMIGGIVVGITSVGSGSLMIIMLLFLYPMLGANQLVGAARGLDPQRIGVPVAQRFPAVGNGVLTDHPWPVHTVRDVVQHVEAKMPACGVHRGTIPLAHGLLERQPAARLGW